MGSGKTLICLALIRSTLHHKTQPPTNTAIPYHVITIKGLHDRLASDTATDADRSLIQLHSDLRFGLDHYKKNARHKDRANYRVPFYYINFTDPEGRGIRSGTGGRRIYLSNATLIIVPSILMPQWTEEIDKHMDSSTLNAIVIQDKSELWAFEKLPLNQIFSPHVSSPGLPYLCAHGDILQIVLIAAECECTLYGPSSYLPTLGLMTRQGEREAREGSLVRPSSTMRNIRWKRLILG
jgi:hypothetical protein